MPAFAACDAGCRARRRQPGTPMNEIAAHLAQEVRRRRTFAIISHPHPGL
jgi:hypothetical protein